jgi:hypothetical protein
LLFAAQFFVYNFPLFLFLIVPHLCLLYPW